MVVRSFGEGQRRHMRILVERAVVVPSSEESLTLNAVAATVGTGASGVKV